MMSKPAYWKQDSATYFIKDGKWTTHDIYSPGMAKQYLLPGNTHPEGMNLSIEKFKAEIYGGFVKRDSDGNVKIRR